MAALNYQLLREFSLKDAKLRTVEKRNDSIISILKRRKEKLEKRLKPKKSSTEKFFELKQRQSAYTFKLPDVKQQKCVQNYETFKHGWRVGSELRLPARVKELSQRRSKMIVIGNSHSLNNKTSSGSAPATCKESDKHKMSPVEMRQEMLMKSKQLGNRFSHALVNHRKASTNGDKFDRRLITRKLGAGHNKCVQDNARIVDGKWRKIHETE